MSRLLLLIFLLLTGFAPLLAQKLAISEAKPEAKQKGQSFLPLHSCGDYAGTFNPLTPESFNKMMRSDFRYAIVGSKAPVSGFKIETNNPSVTVSGNAIVKNNFLATLQVTASTQNNLSEIFSQQKLNGTFSASLGLNRLMNIWQKGVYKATDQDKVLKHQVIEQYAAAVSLKLDTMLVYAIIGKDRLANMLSFARFIDTVEALHDRYEKEGSACSANGASVRATLEKIARGIFKKYLKDDNSNSDDDLMQNFKVSLAALAAGQATPNFNDLAKFEINMTAAKPLVADVKGSAQKFIDQVNDSCIAIFKDIWSRKRIVWINLAPNISNSSLTMYDTVHKKISDTTSFLFGMQLSVNFLVKYRESYRYIYGKLGVDIGKVSNIADLKKLSYQQSGRLDSSSSSTLTSQKIGTAYKGALDRGFGWDVFFEFYGAVFKSPAAPGLYLKPMLLHGDPYIKKDRLSLDLGIVWNLANADKTKNVVTIVPYVNWSNLLKDENVSTASLFSAGVKFGIPINLGN